MARIKNWQLELWMLLKESQEISFEWGTHDCATFACRVIKTVTGKEPLLLVSWKDEAEAIAIIEQADGLQSLVERHLGPAINWGQCGAGDLVLVNMPNGDAIAIHDGAQLIAPSPRGLRKIPFQLAICGWRV